MKKLLAKKNSVLIFLLIILIASTAVIAYVENIRPSSGILYNLFYPDEEIEHAVQLILENRNKAIINQDLELIKSMYNTSTKYGRWAFEYEQRKLKYIQNWGQKQGVKFIDIVPKIVVRSIKDKGEKVAVNLMCSTEYKYVYEDALDQVNSSRIGTYHVLELMKEGENWIITKEWYNDPFADSLNLDRINDASIKKYILSQGARDFSTLLERRSNAVAYADKYCGAASEEQYGFKYNKSYRNYNSLGGDCANFASQIMFEGAKFKKNKTWNYDKKGATRAWVNADGFKKYMTNSGRASVIAYGSYEKVYKASYKLLPGDFVAYEKKGDITHISVVTGADSRGYALVSCHNTDRSKVPWDLGWSNSSIKFWLIRVHY